MTLSIFHVREIGGSGREVVLRAHSAHDAAELAGKALGARAEEVLDRFRFTIEAVNYGDEFLVGGPRGVIAIF